MRECAPVREVGEKEIGKVRKVSFTLNYSVVIFVFSVIKSLREVIRCLAASFSLGSAPSP